MQVQNPVREDIAKLKEDIANFKQEMMVCNNVYGNNHHRLLSVCNSDLALVKVQVLVYLLLPLQILIAIW